MSPPPPEDFICGAGIAGITAAYHPAVRRGGTRGAVRAAICTGVPSEYQAALPEGSEDQLIGTDVTTARALARPHYSALNGDRLAVLSARSFGWLSGQQGWMCLIEPGREKRG